MRGEAAGEEDECDDYEADHGADHEAQHQRQLVFPPPQAVNGPPQQVGERAHDYCRQLPPSAR